MEKYKIPYFSIDHLKMGLIRSKQTALTVDNDTELVPYLWKIVKEMVKTAIENRQNMIIEGCYIPFDWQKDFAQTYLAEIKFYCLVMTAEYIENNFSDILRFESIIEKRMTTDIHKTDLIAENKQNLQLCKQYGLHYILIDNRYEVDIAL